MSFARKNSNQASSSSIVDSVVGCLHTLSWSLSHHTSNRKHESRDLQIIIRDYVVCHEHRNRFLISCGDVFWCCYSINSPADIEVTNWWPLSDSELISRREMRLLACVTKGPSEEPYHTVSTVYLILGIWERTSGARVDHILVGTKNYTYICTWIRQNLK